MTKAQVLAVVGTPHSKSAETHDGVLIEKWIYKETTWIKEAGVGIAPQAIPPSFFTTVESYRTASNVDAIFIRTR